MTLESKFNSCLFYNRVCRKTGFYLSIDSEVSIGNGAEPNVVVSFSMPNKRAVVFRKNFSHFFFIFRHLYRQRFSSLRTKSNGNGFCSGGVVQVK